MKLEPCKHLDYEKEKYPNYELIDLSPLYPVKYWKRTSGLYEGAPVNVQFCKKRGRINSIFDCYQDVTECYETENRSKKWHKTSTK